MEREQAEQFAETVRRAREARGLSIRKAASRGRVSDTTWRRLEDPVELGRYEPRADTLRATARALGVTLDQVYHWAGRAFHGIDDPKPLEEALAEGDPGQHVPAALAAAWGRLTHEQRERVVGYAQALAGDTESRGDTSP